MNTSLAPEPANTTLAPKESVVPRFLENKQIIVIDDDKALLIAVTKVLRQYGARVLTALSVSDATRYLTLGYGPIHLVLTDMRMPVVSGKLVLSAMHGSARHVPTIVMTAYATQTLRDECALLGAAAFIEKPFDTASLIDLIRSVLAQAHSGHHDPQST